MSGLASYFAFLFVAAAPLPPTGAGLSVDADYPGGNIVVERIEGDDVYLHQDQRDTPGFWFYWNFRVRGAAGRQLAFHFTQGNPLGTRGPATSLDGGRQWNWLGVEAVDGPSFRYGFAADAHDVRFAMAIPYLQADLERFLARYPKGHGWRLESHATSEKGRTVERLRLGKIDGEPLHRVLLLARHHACESMANYALEGLMESVLEGRGRASWLRENVEIALIPFVDKDGVEAGDQGKNRTPHDHNRDYYGDSIYASVRANKAFAAAWPQGKLRMVIDWHCPYIRGGADRPGSSERLVFYGSRSATCAKNLETFCRMLEDVQQGPLVYDRRHNLPYGVGNNQLTEPRSASAWGATLDGILISTTLEVPYANVGPTTVTPDAARALGHDMAEAMARYLATLP